MTNQSIYDSMKLPEVMFKSKEEKIVADLLNYQKDITFDWSKVRTSTVQQTLARESEKLTSKSILAMQKSIDKILRNSLFGSMSGSHKVFDAPKYTATILKVETGDLRHRVKIRCPNWEATGPTFPSESHACEDYAARVVKPWVDENCAHPTLHMNYAVFAFENETDASLCYMRFR